MDSVPSNALRPHEPDKTHFVLIQRAASDDTLIHHTEPHNASGDKSVLNTKRADWD